MNFAFRPVLLASLLAVAGCNSNSGSSTSSSQPSANTSPATNSVGSSDQASASPTKAGPRAFVRGAHVVPSAGAVTLRSNNTSLGQAFTFGNASQFVAIEPGEKVQISAVGAGNTRVSGPMPVDLDAGDDLTVIVNGVPGDVALLPFKGKSGGPQSGKSKISFAHAAKELGEIEIKIDGARYRDNVDYGDGTDYKVLEPGRHNFTVAYSRQSKAAPAPTPTLVPNQISPQPTPFRPREIVTLLQPADLAAGKVYTLIVFYDASKNPKVRLLEDRFADTLQNAPVAR